MDRIEDQANFDGTEARARGDVEHGSPSGMWASDTDRSESVAIGSDDGELLFDSSDPIGRQVDGSVELAPSEVSSEAGSLTFVERRSQPWLADEVNGVVDSQLANNPWPTLDVSSPEVDLDRSAGSERLDSDHESFSPLSVTDGIDTSATGGMATADVPDDRIEGRQSCRLCEAPVSQINIKVDGNALILESCDECDSRRWRLDGQQIDLKRALNEVGEHAGRRR